MKEIKLNNTPAMYTQESLESRLESLESRLRVVQESLESRSKVAKNRSKTSGVSDAQKRAHEKYNKSNDSQIAIRLDSATKAIWDSHVKNRGESLRSFLIRSANEQMRRDNGGEPA